MIRKVVLQSVWVLISVLNAQEQQAQQLLAKQDKHYFIENKGQWHSDVLYLARMGGLDAWITKYGVNYTFYKLEEVASPNKKEEDLHLPEKFRHKDYTLIGHRVLMQLENHNANPARESKHQQLGYYNYFIGNDPSKHATNVGLFKEAFVKDVYPGIGMRYYFDRGRLRYDYVVHAGADPSQIHFKLTGANKTYLNDKGQLVFETRFGEVAMADLEVYQGRDKKRVEAEFVCKAGERWGFSLGEYDKTQDLVIDPLIYSTYLGGSDYDYGEDISTDANGNAYITGTTNSVNYDTTAGAFQTTFAGNSSGFYEGDVVVTKINSDGTALIYSSYFGGSDSENGYGIFVDDNGNAYITGFTSSTDFIVTPGAYQTTHADGDTIFADAFVTKFNNTGTALFYSTFLGGSNQDESYSIVVDANGNAYITGYTSSLNYDIKPGAYQLVYGGGEKDAFITKLNNTGSDLVYSTYLGGNNEDIAYDLALDNNGNIHITGVSSSLNFDIKPGALQTIGYAFVTKLNATGTTIIYSTYIGGNYAIAYSLALDPLGNVCVAGSTSSMDMYVSPGAYQTIHEGGQNDAYRYDGFVIKLNNAGTAYLFSTYIGGSGHDYIHNIDVDNRGNVYISGTTLSQNFDITPDTLKSNILGDDTEYSLYGDIFISVFNPTGTHLVYSSYFGAGGYASATKLDANENIYITGSAGLITTPNAYQQSPEGGGDAYVVKINLSTRVSKIKPLSELNIRVYPNPASSQFVIESERGSVFELLDVTGRVLERLEVKGGRQSIPIHYPAGLYFIREQASGATQKLVIE